MIKSISVRRKKGTVCYCSRYNAMLADKVTKNLNIISISYSDEPDTVFHNAASVLYLRQVNSSSDIDFDLVDPFIKGLDGESILVHCNMGKVRSKYLAEQIWVRYGYKLTQAGDLIYQVYYH